MTKKRRANNLILYNVPENTSAIIDERVKHDLVTIKRVFDDKNLHIKSKDITNVFRLGKDQNKGHPRPVLVKFSKEEIKKNVLSHCKDLKLKVNNENIPIYYSSDRTVKEREERRKLVEEMKRRKSNGENQIGIRNGKIVTILGSNDRNVNIGSLLEQVF